MTWPLTKAREPNALATTKKRIREHKKDAGKVDPMPLAPPSTMRQIAKHRAYYSEVEFTILRSINGTQYK